MSDFESGQRTQAPTERRRREARERGEVAKSSQLTSALILLMAGIAFWLIAPTSTNPLLLTMKTRLSVTPMSEISTNSAAELIRSQLFLVLSLVLPLAILLTITGLAANLFQTGWLWIPSRLIPRFTTVRKNPGWTLAEPTSLALRMALLGCMTWRFVVVRQWQWRSMSLTEPGRMLSDLTAVLAEFGCQLAAGLVLLGFVDYGYRYWRYEQSLKMTLEEVRREQREDSVDPLIRDRRSRLNHRDAQPAAAAGVAPIEAVRV